MTKRYAVTLMVYVDAKGEDDACSKVDEAINCSNFEEQLAIEGAGAFVYEIEGAEVFVQAAP